MIPPANYARLEDVATAIQQQIDTFIGATGLAGKVTVSAQSGQLILPILLLAQARVFRSLPTLGEPQAMAALGLGSLFAISGTNEIVAPITSAST